MDKTEKGIVAVFGSLGCFALILIAATFGLAIWGFVELILWITSK